MVSMSTMIAVCCLSIAFNWNSIRVCNICCPVTWCTNTIRLLWCHSWLWKHICSLHCIFLLFSALSWHRLSDMRPYTCHSCHGDWLGADRAEEGRRDWVSNFLSWMQWWWLASSMECGLWSWLGQKQWWYGCCALQYLNWFVTIPDKLYIIFLNVCW